MLSNIQKTIMIRALELQIEAGEDPAEVLERYRNLSEEEKEELLMITREC